MSEIVESVDRTHERITLTKNGRAVVMIVSVEDWESMEETLGVLSDPETMRRINEAEQEIDLGIKGTSVAEVRAALKARTSAKTQ